MVLEDAGRVLGPPCAAAAAGLTRDGAGYAPPMANGQPGTLVRLSDTGETVADPQADVRGRTVVDRDGQEIGTIDDLLVDDQEHKVRFLRVGEGGFLGIGKTHVLIPIDAITGITKDEVRIDRNRQDMTQVPGYDPELVYEPDYYSGVYGWWGYPTFWGPGYVYPGYPYS